MKNRCKNSKTILLNKNPHGYFENNYQHFHALFFSLYSINTIFPIRKNSKTKKAAGFNPDGLFSNDIF